LAAEKKQKTTHYHPTTTSMTQHKSFGLQRILGLLTIATFIARHVFFTPHLQKLQSNSVDSSRSCLDELTEEEIMEVISDDSVLPGFRPFEDKTTREARKVKRKFSSAPQMKENSFVFVTVLFHVVFYIFFALICYHHVNKN